MPSPEGKGNARSTWKAFADRMESEARVGALKPLARRFAGPMAMEQAGFWLLWHLEGGFDGLLRLGMSRSSIYRRIKQFRSEMGVHPDEYAMPGVKLDLREYLSSPAPVKSRN
jgi:hypothetical protein